MDRLRWDLGGSTWGFFRQDNESAWVPVSEAVRTVVGSGLGVEIWPTRNLHGPDPSGAELESIRQAARDAPFASVHVRGRYWRWSPTDLRREIDFTAGVGARTLVIHPASLGLTEPRDRLDAEEVTRIAGYGADRGVRFALENVRNASWALDRVLDEIGDDPERTNVAVCIDVGHAFLSDDLGVQPIHGYLERYRSQMAHLHLHDNAGIEDDHIPPGDGGIDWRDVLRVLDEFGFAGTAILEVARRGEDALRTIDEGVRFLRSLARRLEGGAQSRVSK